MPINVTEARFGAIGNGSADDTAAIQRAIDYAKTVATAGGGTYRPTVYFPAGYYYITAPINITNTSGLWLTGDGGKWLNTCIFGNTGGAMFDFSGSNQSGCEDFYFLSTATSGASRSTIGVQFALTSNGGLNCSINNCSFLMEDFPTANNGLGTIGLLNVRAEEFSITGCFIRANTPIVLTNTTSLSAAGINFTAGSRYQTLTAGVGSMGVVDITGASIQVQEKRQPALILNGTNSVNFHGYIGRATVANGSNETAILCSQYTTNLRVHATIESFSRAMRVLNTAMDGAQLNLVVANSTAPTTEVVDVTNSYVKGMNLHVSLPVPSERTNRFIVYHAPVGGGNQPVNAFVRNSEIFCYDTPNNQYIISANLLRRAANITLHTDLPFEKKGGRLHLLNNSVVAAGTVGNVTAATVLQFRQANQLPFTNTNGGYYRVWLDGVVRSGGFGSGAACTLCFQAQIVVNQLFNGTFDPPSITIITLDKSVTNPAYMDIVGVHVNITFANGLGTVTVTPRVRGSGTAEPVSYDGCAQLQSDFLVNDPIPIA